MLPIISSDSPFRRIPTDMPRRQILYLDALRLSAEMAGVAFDRLHNLLVLAAKRPPEDPLAGKPVRALLDAYSVIDSVHRFRELLDATPNLEHNEVFKLFMRKTKDVKQFRHIVQHLRREVDQIAREGLAALGTLTWLGPSAVADGPPSAYILQAGTSYPGQLTIGPLIDTQSSLPKEEISEISLATAGVRVNLSGIVDRVRSIIRSLEVPLEEFAADKERFGSDRLMCFTLEPVKEREERGEPDAT